MRERHFQADFSKLSPFFFKVIIRCIFDEDIKFVQKKLSKMTTFRDMMENVVKN